MTEMSGDEFLSRVRSMSSATRILVAGFSDLISVIRAVNEGNIFDYVRKSWNVHSLRLSVNKAAEHHTVTRNPIKGRNLLDNLMNPIPEAAQFKDADHRIIKINIALARADGIEDTAQAAGKTIFHFLDPDDARAIEKEERNVLTTDQRVIDHIECISEKNGPARWLSKTLVPVVDDRGVVTSVIGQPRTSPGED